MAGVGIATGNRWRPGHNGSTLVMKDRSRCQKGITVATVPIDEHNAAECISGTGQFNKNRREGVGSDRQRPFETRVLTGSADGERGAKNKIGA